MDVQKVLQFCIAKLVDNPEMIQITRREAEDRIVYEVRVAPTDLARIIGKEGKTFKALRALINLPQAGSPYDLVVDSL
jgi:uncharacterized protein